MLMKETRALRWKCTLKFFLVMAVSAATAILLACSGGGGGGGSSRSSGGGGGGAEPTGELAFVTTTNFSDSGSYSTINLRNNRADEDLPSEAGIIESDNDAVYYNNRVYVINRLGFDNITVLDASDLSTAVKQFSTGNGSNPQDMAFVSGSQAYVSLLEENDLLRVDPTAAAGSEIVARIDLSGFAALYNDPDGIVEAKSLVIVGKYLFVGLQLLDRNNFFSPTATSVLAVVDTTDDTLVDVNPGGAIDGIVLTGTNPQFMRYVAELGKIVVSETGSFSVNDGGLETVDPWSFDAEGFFIDENELDGDLGDFVIVDGLRGYAVIGFLDANFDFFNKVVIFDVETGTNQGDLTGDLPFIPSLALDGSKRVLVPDRTLTEPGIRIFDSFTDTEVTASPIDVGLPPNVVIVIPPDPPTAFVATTNFTDSASYSTINLRNNRADEDLPSEAGIIESDNDAVYYNNMVYVINRLGFDNITVLDVSDLSTAVRQFSTGNGSNPQDMAFVSDSQAYVSLLEVNDLLRVNPMAAAGSEIVSRIDLSGFAALYNDPDGIVEAKSLVIVGKYLFVGLQLLDRNNFFSPTATSVLAVIDTTNDTLVDVNPGGAIDGIVLTGTNPQFMRYVPDVGKIVVSETGSFGVNDGGLESVDPWSFDAEGFFIDENELDGDLGDFVIVDGLRGYAVISFLDANFDFFNKVVIFDVETGTNQGDLTGDLPFIPSLALDGSKQVLVPDRTLTEPGIRIFDSFTDTEVTASPIDVGLPPNVVIVLYQ